MMKRILNISFSLVLCTAIICSVGVTKAFAMPNVDIATYTQKLQASMQQVQEIKQEIDQVRQAIDEIRNGGFMSAAGALFGQFSGGGFDRFGKNFKGLGGNLKGMGDTFAASKRIKNALKEGMAQGLSYEEALSAAQQKEVSRQQGKQDAKYKKDLSKAKEKAVKRRAKELLKQNSDLTEMEARAKAQEEYADKTLEQIKLENQSASKLNNAYNWLQNSGNMFGGK